MNSVVALINAPEGFDETLGKLPEGVVLRKQARDRSDLTLWFTKSRKDLERYMDRMIAFIGESKLWIAWPKKASNMATDLS